METNKNYDGNLPYNGQVQEDFQYDQSGDPEVSYIEEKYDIDQYNFYPDAGF